MTGCRTSLRRSRGQLTRKTERGQYPALIKILSHRFRENFLRDTTGIPERAS